MAMGGDSRPKVVGSNLGSVYWMDIFSHIFVVKKEAGVGPFFLKKNYF